MEIAVLVMDQNAKKAGNNFCRWGGQQKVFLW
jgi:hypothetical protein